MYSGWTVKWRVNRPLSEDEKTSALPRKKQHGVEADDRATLVAFNSTYTEFVGRRFRLRGSLGTILATLTSIGFVCIPFILFSTIHINKANLIGLSVATVFMWLAVFFLYCIFIRKEFFTSTYYPIRFNRKTRRVYVYRDKCDGGIIEVPWEDGFFHVGKGVRDKYLLDLRCHILDGETVKDTFVTGMYYLEEKYVKQLWEFVRCYMDGGIESLGKVKIFMTPSPSLRNCYFMARTGGGVSQPLAAVLLPIMPLIALMRWLVLHTCKPPAWPEHIEKACRVDPDDPHHLSEPDYIGQFSAGREQDKQNK